MSNVRSKKPLLFIDFDDTLFSQSRFYEWMDTYLETHQVPHGEFSKRSDEFHQSKGANLRLYDHEAHMKAISGREWSFMSAEIEDAIQKDGVDFCFSDSHAFLESIDRHAYMPRLLSYGDPAFQYFKMNTCKFLRGIDIPKHIVLEPKAEFINREYSGRKGILIDDKGPQRLPPHWTHLWLQRHGKLGVHGTRDVLRISDLTYFDSATETIMRRK